MALIADYYHGKVHLIITCSNPPTEKEKEAILERIGRNASRALQAEANRKAALDDKTA
jgi:hypothetical protein